MTKLLDLGDFIPETYKISFSINKRKYEFEYAEASVDEVLRLMFEETEAANLMDRQRKVVTEFLVKHVQGEAKNLREDLATLPYLSTREGLDISKIYQALQNRFTKKKSSGAA